jgi:hypothetical protein
MLSARAVRDPELASASSAVALRLGARDQSVDVGKRFLSCMNDAGSGWIAAHHSMVSASWFTITPEFLWQCWA